MIPNELLKEHYLTNVNERGFAKIDNKIFFSLKNPNAKRIFDIISRFKGEYDIYPISVERLQIFLGALSTKGKVLKSAYANERDFVNRLVKPALEHIAKCPTAKGVLELVEKNGHVGYELQKTTSSKLKIKFNVRWLEYVEKPDKAKRKEVLASIDRHMQLYREIIKRDGDGLDELEKISALLASIGESTEPIDKKIQQTKMEREKKALEKEDTELLELEKRFLSGLSDLICKGSFLFDRPD